MEWFFFMIMARKNGATSTIVTAAPATFPQKSPKAETSRGRNRLNDKTITATHKTE